MSCRKKVTYFMIKYLFVLENIENIRSKKYLIEIRFGGLNMGVSNIHKSDKNF